jgi:hypothetical protein
MSKNYDPARVLEVLRATSVDALERGAIDADDYAAVANATVDDVVAIQELALHIMRELPSESIAGALASIMLKDAGDDILAAKRQVAVWRRIARDSRRRAVAG